MAFNIVMIGPPGAGKGTQSERLGGHYRIPRISTGDILREAVHAGTSLGRQVKQTIAAGSLVSDEIMIDVVRERLVREDTQPGFILDGFPRTVVQARALDGILEGRGPVIPVVLMVPEDELVRRLALRRVCVDCGATFGAPGASPKDQAVVDTGHCSRCGGELAQRDDDEEGVIRQRLQVFSQITEPLVAYYQDRPTYVAVDGLQSPEQVFAALVKAIDRARAVERGEDRERARA